MARRLSIVALALGLAGCTNLEVGRRIPHQQVNEILPGRTKRSDITRMFGSPHRTVQGDGGQVLVFRYMDGEGYSEELIVSFDGEDVQWFALK